MYLHGNLQSLCLCSWVCSVITGCTSSSLKPKYTLELLAWKTLRCLKMPPYEEVIYYIQILTVPFPLLSFPSPLLNCLYNVLGNETQYLCHIYLLLVCMCHKNSGIVESTINVFKNGSS